MEKFFTKAEVRKSISNFMKMLEELSPDDTFSQYRNEHISSMLKNFLSHAEDWDRKAVINIKAISNSLHDQLQDKDSSKESLDEVFASCLRFLIEFYIYMPGDLSPSYHSIKSFAVHKLDGFSESAKRQIEYALRDMPMTILKDILHSEDFQTIRSFPSVTKEAERLKSAWDQELDDRLQKVEELSNNLRDYQHAYNFVSLYQGFLELGNKKDKECRSSKIVVLSLGILMILPIIIETLYFIFKGSNFVSAWDLLKVTPAASLTLLFVYFFRIALRNHTSLKAQHLQIELRKTLCTFIQSYVSYSKDFKSKDHNPLEKFEDVVFSNIMSIEDKIPSTFDGIDQLANVITAFKSSKN